MASPAKVSKRRNKIPAEADVLMAENEATKGIRDTVEVPNEIVQTAQSSESETVQFQGYLEQVSQNKVTGWCYQINDPQKKLVIEFIENQQTLGIAMANILREDLQNAGIGDGAHSFCWMLPPGISSLQLSNLQARVLDSDFYLENQVKPEIPLPSTSRITVDNVHASGIVGWVFDDGQFDEMMLGLEVNGKVVGKYPANILRKDVIKAGFGQGRFGFVLPLPDSCFSGETSKVRISSGAFDEVLELEIPPDSLTLCKRTHFQLEQGIISGRLTCTHLNNLHDKLNIFVDDELLTSISLPYPLPSQFTFQFELPLIYSDGQEHRVFIAISNSGMRLPSTNKQASITYTSHVKGKIDSIDVNGLVGWVFDIDHPNEELVIDMFDGEQWIDRTRTISIRNDVNKLFHLKGNHGFHFVFPSKMYDKLNHSIRIVCQGKEVNRKMSLSWPVIFQPEDLAKIPPEKRYAGKLEIANINRVSGWVCDKLEPNRPLEVAIYIDDQYQGSVEANRFSARLRGSGYTGHQIFLFNLPLTLMNGKKRKVKAVIVESNYEISSVVNDIYFPLVDVLGACSNPSEEKIAPNFSYSPPPFQYQTSLQKQKSWDLIDLENEQPLFSIIVLNWNGILVLRDFLESFLRVQWTYSYELIVIDHGSIDGSLELLEEYGKQLPIRLIARGANYSFAASNNLGVRHARGRLMVFANNDLVMLHDCLSGMAQYLLDPEVGAVGLKLLEPLRTANGGWRYITHHQGVKFSVSEPLPDSRQRYYLPIEIGEDVSSDLAATYEMPIATGALLMCRIEDFTEIGGFCEGYFYGMEDVDLCLLIKRRLGKKILCDTSVVGLHNRSATRDSKLQVNEKTKLYNAQIHSKNRQLYIERFGRSLTRTILHSVILGDQFWRAKPLRVVFVVTSTDINTAAGDLFTALELAEAMHRLFGWDTLFVNYREYAIPNADVLIAMRHDYQIEKIQEANPGLITVAWARNRIDEWIATPYFGAYQVLFCSSQKAIDYVREQTSRESFLLPIATNAMRFSPKTPSAKHISDVTFTGSFWGDQREAITLQDLELHDFAIYGYGWEKCAEWHAHWRGGVAYDALPEIYSSASIVLDDSHPVTRVWNSLNSRVFDALATGKLVLTNCSGGAQELFAGMLPYFETADELQALLKHYMDNSEEREDLAYRLQSEVLAKHTYDHRARTFKDVLISSFSQGLRFAIKIGVPRLDEQQAWGDYHFALGIKRALEKQGHYARIDILPDWYSGLTASDDVVIVLRGLSHYKPQPTTLNLMWLISHPDDVKLSEFQQYDHVFVASESFAERLQSRLKEKVSTLMQCTDPSVFYPEQDDSLDLSSLLFVGNSRGQRREGVQFSLEQDLDFCVWGELWEGILPASRLRGKHIPNHELRRYYTSAKLVLNDHWPDMRSEGFISNRMFDAGACGAMLLTDEMKACRELFGDAVAYYDSAESLQHQYHSLLNSPEERHSRTAKLQQLIIENHTFENRVADILVIVQRLNTTLKTV